MQNVKCLHFVGIGGAGMSSLAVVYLSRGSGVTGSDIKESTNTSSLREQGAEVFIGHNEKNVIGADLVVVSSAIPSSNCEVLEAKRRKLPIISRAELLAFLMSEKDGIAIAGTHGKTTTTSMISLMLDKNGLDPTFLIGGELNDIGSGAKHGKGKYLVAEADESDGSLLCLKPKIAVLTNVEADHLDYYRSLREIEETFINFLNQLPSDGYALICGDHPVSKKLLSSLKGRYYIYGLGNDCHFQAKKIKLTIDRSQFDFCQGEEKLGTVSLGIPGLHNVYNALATISLGILLGLAFEGCARAIKDFSGVRRRFQYLGEAANITLVDDYAHHPSEVEATLKAARTGNWNRVITVFQPHRYTRTSHLHSDFGKAFFDADMVVITDVYAADEEPIPGVDGKLIVDSILREEPYKNVAYLPKKADICDFLLSVLEEGDVLLTMGAGDVWMVGSEILSELKNNASEKSALR